MDGAATGPRYGETTITPIPLTRFRLPIISPGSRVVTPSRWVTISAFFMSTLSRTSALPVAITFPLVRWAALVTRLQISCWGTGRRSARIQPRILKWYYPARETYVQDQIKVSRRLTATVGLRWAPFFGYQEQLGRITAFRPGQQSTVFPNAPTGLVVAGDRGISKSSFDTKWLNFAPQLGFSYDLTGTGKMVIRGGAGITYDYYNLSQAGNIGNAAPYGFVYSPAGVAVSVTDPYMGQPAPFPYIKPIAGSDAAKNYVFTGNPIIIGYESSFNAGRTYQMNGTFEWEPAAKLVNSRRLRRLTWNPPQYVLRP